MKVSSRSTPAQQNALYPGSVNAYADFDTYNVTLNGGTSYTIEVKGKSSDNGSLLDPYVQLQETDGTYLASNDDGGTDLDARLVVGINTAGTYSFVVSEAAVERGIYVVSVTEN